MDGNALIALVNSYLQPALNAIMVITPTAAAVYCGVAALKFYAMDESEQQQHPIGPTIKKAVVIAVIVFSISAILKIFGVQ
jgi:DMSO reductase anchor subunit